MMATASGRYIPQLVRSTLALIPDMMKIEIPRRPAPRHRAALMIAREHLAPHSRRDRRRYSCRLIGVERSDPLRVALGA